MKTKSILALVVMLSAALATQAQSFEPAVKILPTGEKGILKVVYAHDAQSNVDVKFLGENGLLVWDRIKSESFSKGFTKKYNVRNIREKSFAIEISSAEMTVRYKMIKSKDGSAYVPYLESTTLNHPLVASIN